jgi:hypothetical protein
MDTEETPMALRASALRSTTYNVADAWEANEFYQQRGWTDGLPIVPPTEASVLACLRAADLSPGDLVGIEPVRQRPVTAEKVAVNAVMAGCLPAYLPVVVAVLRAMCHEQFNLHGSSASTGGSAPFIVVNGPVRTAIGMNATHNVLGQGARANATIGRAVRLVLTNVLGYVPGQLDRSTLGHPGKFTFCLAEDEDESSWTPLAQERGAPAGCSAVTVMACGAPRQVMNEWTRAPEDILETFAADMRHNMLTYSVWAGSYALVIPTQLREILVAAGWLIYREGGSQSTQGLTPFAAVTFAPSNRNTFPWFFSAGCVYSGLIPGRDNDTAAFGLAYGKFSKYLGGQDYEMVLEWTYEVAIAPWLTLQPDLQYIIKPSGMSQIANALVGGMQIAINF